MFITIFVKISTIIRGEFEHPVSPTTFDFYVIFYIPDITIGPLIRQLSFNPSI